MILRWLRGRARTAEPLAKSKETSIAAPVLANDQAAQAVAMQIDAALNEGDTTTAQQLLAPWLQQPEPLAAFMLFAARLQRQQGNFVKALDWAERALLEHEHPAEVHYQLGETLFCLKDIQGALDALNTALALDQNHAKAWLRYGDILAKQEKNNAALEAYQTALPLCNEKQKNLARLQIAQALHALQRWPEATAAFQEIVIEEPENTTAWTSLGNLELIKENDANALVAYLSAQAIYEKNKQKIPLVVELHLALCYQYCGKWTEALKIYQQLHTKYPRDSKICWYLSLCELALKNWPKGWELYDSRFMAGASNWRPMPFPIWNGESMPEKTLLVLADQGLGDEIMFASCIPDTQQQVSHVILECEPRLEKLFQRSFPGVSIIASERERDARWFSGLPNPDAQIAAGDLPRFFRQQSTDFPQHSGYLQADHERIQYWHQRLAELGPGYKVGISWRGGVSLTRQRTRSTTPQDWANILATPNCQFISLQYGDCQSDLAEFQQMASGRVHEFPEVIPDYDETAALVMALDLVVTVCTSIVHLGGALGKPVWVLVPYAPGWRYQAAGDTMPWYPSVRLFRQPDMGDWARVCQNLSTKLHEATKKSADVS